jgi:hypothetical protein
MAYLKKVTDAQTDVGYGSGWFKIQEAGLNVATQDWATTDLVLISTPPQLRPEN